MSHLTLIRVSEISTQEMRYTLAVLHIDLNRMTDAAVRSEYQRRFGERVRRNPNIPHPDR